MVKPIVTVIEMAKFRPIVASKPLTYFDKYWTRKSKHCRAVAMPAACVYPSLRKEGKRKGIEGIEWETEEKEKGKRARKRKRAGKENGWE